MFKFVLISACVLFSVALAGHYGGYDGGHSNTQRHQDDHGNYEFKYDIKDGHGNVHGRSEKGGHHGVVGSYYLGEIDGRHRSVEYQADKLGFRASVKTNEPGTKSSEPAFAPYHSAYGNAIPSGSVHSPVGQHASYGGAY